MKPFVVNWQQAYTGGMGVALLILVFLSLTAKVAANARNGKFTLADHDTPILSKRNLQTVSHEPCVNESTISYHRNGQVEVLKTFATCIENALDPLLFEGYATQTLIPFKAQISLNNLVEVNEVQNTVTIDFLLRVYWTDSRLDMPAMWDALGPSVSASGIDLIQYLETNGHAFWLPDFVFSEASSMEITNSFIKLYPGGFIYWNRHVQMTLFSTTLQYQKYPEDTQDVILRFFSYTIGDNLLTIQEKDPGQGVVLYPNYDSSPAIIHNPVWEFNSAHAVTQITDFGTATGAITRSVFVVHLNISRRANGIILKLALPMLFLALMGAMSFWTSVEERISTTMTVLLAISALYIVVFANIPMLGYLTKFDKFVVELTTILFFITATHHIVIRYQRDDVLEKHPLRKVFLRLFDFFGRVMLIPLMLLVYLTLFTSFSSAVLAFFVIVLGISCAIGYRESGSVKNSFVAAVDEVNAKSQDVDQKDTLTGAERYTLQFLRNIGYQFGAVLPGAGTMYSASGGGNKVGVSAKNKDLQQFYESKDEVLNSRNPYYREGSSRFNNAKTNTQGNINQNSTSAGVRYTAVANSSGAPSPTAPNILNRRVLSAKTPAQVEMPRTLSSSVLQSVLLQPQQGTTASSNAAAATNIIPNAAGNTATTGTSDANAGSTGYKGTNNVSAGTVAGAGTASPSPPAHRPRTEARNNSPNPNSQRTPNTSAAASSSTKFT